MRYFVNLNTALAWLRPRVLAATGVLGLVIAGAGTATAAGPTTPTSYPPTQCGGKQIVNVNFQLTNDADSGFFGNWATDNFKRSLKLFDLGDGTYCATVNDTGSFVTTGPNSPQAGVPLAAGIKGVMNGGYVTNDFSGTLDPNPVYKSNGNLGTFDANGPRPSYVSYFSPAPTTDTLQTWGWTYHTAQNGDWTNASSGSSGDITGN